MRSLLWVASCGAEQLALERREGRAGAAHEEAVVAALRLLHTALQQDQQTVLLLRQEDAMGAKAKACVCMYVHAESLSSLFGCCGLQWALFSSVGALFSSVGALLVPMHADMHNQPSIGMYAPLDAILTQRQTLRLLLEYVSYSHNPALQLLALRVAHRLVPRVPAVVDVLLEQGYGAAGWQAGVGCTAQMKLSRPWLLRTYA